jgi:ribosomal protein S4E
MNRKLTERVIADFVTHANGTHNGRVKIDTPKAWILKNILDWSLRESKAPSANTYMESLVVLTDDIVKRALAAEVRTLTTIKGFLLNGKVDADYGLTVPFIDEQIQFVQTYQESSE